MRIKQSENGHQWLVLDKNDEIIFVSISKADAIQAMREMMWRESKTHRSIK